eukprot:scaffold111261_cov28-Tisochrysis_lutea.AAC.1
MPAGPGTSSPFSSASCTLRTISRSSSSLYPTRSSALPGIYSEFALILMPSSRSASSTSDSQLAPYLRSSSSGKKSVTEMAESSSSSSGVPSGSSHSSSSGSSADAPPRAGPADGAT